MLDDELIDDVAKSMTAAPPEASLAQRVSTRIAEARANNVNVERATRWRPWVLVPVASACALVLAIFVARENSVRLKPDTTPVAPPPVSPAPQPVERGRGPDRLRQGYGESAEALRAKPERAALRRERVTLLARPATPAIEPLEIDRLDVQPLVEMDVIQISPIAIDRIEISAMP